MKKWICKVCNYSHQGEKAPEFCPKCGSPKNQFYQDGGSAWSIVSSLLIVSALATLFFILFSCHSSKTVDNSTVKELDLDKYLGRWYEVARFDHRFERGMEQCTAIYSMRKDGKISITNQGMKNGKWKTSVGKGKMTDTPGVLRVSFFGPFYSDYRIMMLAPDYSYALVGGDGDDYLWILSRTPQLSKETQEAIVNEARRRGYNTDNLIWVKQSDMRAHM